MEKGELQGNIASTMIKLIYAFLWQEYVISESAFFLNPGTEFNELERLLNYLKPVLILNHIFKSCVLIIFLEPPIQTLMNL